MPASCMSSSMSWCLSKVPAAFDIVSTTTLEPLAPLIHAFIGNNFYQYFTTNTKLRAPLKPTEWVLRPQNILSLHEVKLYTYRDLATCFKLSALCGLICTVLWKRSKDSWICPS